MPKKYSFQRPRRKVMRSPPPAPVEQYTVIDDENGIDYSKHTFHVIVIILILLVVAMLYVWMRGMPTRIQG